MDFAGIFTATDLPTSVPFLLGLGLSVGILSGLLGVGGGILMTPALHILGFPMPVAVGTTLTQMVASSTTGTWKHIRRGNVVPSLVAIFGLPALVGVWLGKELMVYWQENQQADQITSLLYIVLLAYIGFVMIRRTTVKADPATTPHRSFGPHLDLASIDQPVSLLFSTAVAMAVGFISALTGLGGGFFYVPVMTKVLGLDLKQAIGSSLACVFLGSVIGAISFNLAGLANVHVAIILALGSASGGLIGATATHYVQGLWIRILFAFLVWAAAIAMLFKRLEQENISYYLLFVSAGVVVISAIANALYHFMKQTHAS